MSNYAREVLQAHNTYRQRHGARLLELSDDLCRKAQAWAEKLAEKNKLEHEPGILEGENVAYAMGKDLDANTVSKMWYDEVSKYDFNKATFCPSACHFSQVVWGASQYLGVGKATSSKGAVYVVAKYSPRGNVLGQFKDQVLPPK